MLDENLISHLTKQYRPCNQGCGGEIWWLKEAYREPGNFDHSHPYDADGTEHRCMNGEPKRAVAKQPVKARVVKPTPVVEKQSLEARFTAMEGQIARILDAVELISKIIGNKMFVPDGE